MIQEIFAEANYRVRVYDETDEPYDSYIIYCSLKIYGIPDGLTDDEVEEIYNGEVGKAVHHGNITRILILGAQAEKTSMDIYDICDCTDADAEFIYSALQEGNVPLAYNESCVRMCGGWSLGKDVMSRFYIERNAKACDELMLKYYRDLFGSRENEKPAAKPAISLTQGRKSA